MKYVVVLLPSARADLKEIRQYIQRESSARVARNFVRELRLFVADLAIFPQRGLLRLELQQDIRVIGFKRRVSVLFIIRGERVVVIGFRYAGRNWSPEFERRKP